MVAAATIAGAVIGAGATAYTGNKQAGAAKSGTNASIAEQARQYNTTRADFAPYRSIGYGALSQLGKLYGIGVTSPEQFQAQQDQLFGDTMLPSGTYTKLMPKKDKHGNIISDNIGNGSPMHRLLSSDKKAGDWYEVWNGDKRIGTLRPGGKNGRFINDTGTDINSLRQQNSQQQSAQNPTGPDTSVFFESPDYQFNLGEGQKAIDRSLVARGRGLSGAGVKEGVRYASGMASNEFGNFYNRLANLAGLGQTATNSTALAGMNAANNNSAALQNLGNTRASIYGQTGQGINNAVQGGISNYMLSQYLKNPS
jgi:hypothetical protein